MKGQRAKLIEMIRLLNGPLLTSVYAGGVSKRIMVGGLKMSNSYRFALHLP